VVAAVLFTLCVDVVVTKTLLCDNIVRQSFGRVVHDLPVLSTCTGQRCEDEFRDEVCTFTIELPEERSRLGLVVPYVENEYLDAEKITIAIWNGDSDADRSIVQRVEQNALYVSDSNKVSVQISVRAGRRNERATKKIIVDFAPVFNESFRFESQTMTGEFSVVGYFVDDSTYTQYQQRQQSPCWMWDINPKDTTFTNHLSFSLEGWGWEIFDNATAETMHPNYEKPSLSSQIETKSVAAQLRVSCPRQREDTSGSPQLFRKYSASCPNNNDPNSPFFNRPCFFMFQFKYRTESCLNGACLIKRPCNGDRYGFYALINPEDPFISASISLEPAATILFSRELEKPTATFDPKTGRTTAYYPHAEFDQLSQFVRQGKQNLWTRTVITDNGIAFSLYSPY